MTTQIDTNQKFEFTGETKTPSQITEEHVEVMKAAKTGADFYNYNDARLLREVQRIDESLITICKAQTYTGDGTDRMPYFGAILTAKGRKFVSKGQQS